MLRRKKKQHDDEVVSTEELDSPTILDFIEQLDNDLVDNNLNHSKTQLRAQAL
jgi:hypothetical protein